MSGDEGEKARASGGGGAGGGEYGTFQGPPSYPPPRPPVVGYPQPAGLVGQRYSRNRAGYHSGTARDYEAGFPGQRYDRLPCCGLGIGWVLFIIGFFLTIPWYAGAILLCFYREKREKPGLIACTVAAAIATIIIIVATVVPHEAHVY